MWIGYVVVIVYCFWKRMLLCCFCLLMNLLNLISYVWFVMCLIVLVISGVCLYLRCWWVEWYVLMNLVVWLVMCWIRCCCVCWSGLNMMVLLVVCCLLKCCCVLNMCWLILGVCFWCWCKWWFGGLMNIIVWFVWCVVGCVSRKVVGVECVVCIGLLIGGVW